MDTLGVNVLHDTAGNPLANSVDWILAAQCQLNIFVDRHHLFVFRPISRQLEDKTSRIQSQIALENSAV